MALSPEQNDAWRALVLLAQVLDGALDAQSQRDGGLPHTYYGMLVSLYETAGRRLSMSALAELQRYSVSRVAHAITSMERSGWVRRERSLDDRRVQFVELTDSGIHLIRRVSPLQATEVRSRVFDQLSDEQMQQLGDISRAIVAGLTAEGKH